MTLAARQIALLDAMGIPVWQMRESIEVVHSEVLASLTEQDRAKCDELIQSADCVFYHNEDESSEAQRLLQAIVFAIGCTWRPEYKLTLPQIEYVTGQTLGKPMCLCFDDTMMSSGLISKGTNSLAVALPSLPTLLSQPALKQQAWLQLQQAMAARDGNV